MFNPLNSSGYYLYHQVLHSTFSPHSVCMYVFCVHLGKKLNDLYATPNIIWVIKSRRMRWTGHVARRGA